MDADTAVAEEMMDVDHAHPDTGNKIPVLNGLQTGKLASFCPTCPQPGINLPEDWKDEPKRYLGHILVVPYSKSHFVLENYSSGWEPWTGILRQII